MTQYSNTMFDEIKKALNKKTNANTSMVFKFDVNDKPYLFRLLPNLKNPSQTLFPYFFHTFKSAADGQSITFTCPTTYGEKCPACQLRFRLWNNGGEYGKARSSIIGRKSKWLVNAYVINDPVGGSSTNGTVKVIRFGKQLHKIIDSAINGDDAEEFGPAIFDLSENGCDFRIKVEASSDGKASKNAWPNYASSKFTRKGKIEGMTEEKMKKIYESCYDLSLLVKPTPANEIQTLIDTHFNEQAPAEVKTAQKENKEPDDLRYDDDNIPATTSEAAPTPASEPVTAQPENEEDVDKKINDLLSSIDE